MGRGGTPVIGPVRWIFIKFPTPRIPYSQIKKIYELELSNFNRGHLSDLEKLELLKIRKKTKTILAQKKRRKIIESSIVFIILIGTSSLIIAWIILA